jgi:hydrogenase nickel incorporation protein HypB
MKKTIQIEESVLDENTKLGNDIRNQLDQANIFSLNIMASPGAGKTSVILKILEKLKKTYKIGVIEGDIVPIDVEKIKQLSVPVVLAHTGGSCHLDGIMMTNALRKFNLTSIDILIVENVGNLICPASFYLGTHRNVVIASVPEGDDKPYKYPSMFRSADLILLNKSDYLAHEQFDLSSFEAGVKMQNKNAEIIQISCRTNEGIDLFIDWIETEKSILRRVK